MNKLELITALKEEAKLSKTEAAQIVDIFFDEMSEALANDDRVEIRGYVLSMLKNINHTKGVILKPEKV